MVRYVTTKTNNTYWKQIFYFYKNISSHLEFLVDKNKGMCINLQAHIGKKYNTQKHAKTAESKSQHDHLNLLYLGFGKGGFVTV